MIGSASDSGRGGFGRQQSFILIVGVLRGLQNPTTGLTPGCADVSTGPSGWSCESDSLLCDR